LGHVEAHLAEVLELGSIVNSTLGKIMRRNLEDGCRNDELKRQGGKPSSFSDASVDIRRRLRGIRSQYIVPVMTVPLRIKPVASTQRRMRQGVTNREPNVYDANNPSASNLELQQPLVRVFIL
jgi:hypothetical protein